ncbi:hypothetical protein [Mesorhizobium carmichaelinearum]|uniref:hypothetical protein n=1 Tax=Mesorhizobium carmichaelinearum TaxID=1208188 RepID=UPI000BA38D46|nr:hypothetical protein [Mesorhizobium carmichaelinearum]
MRRWQLDFWHGSAAVEIADPYLLDNPVEMAPMLSDLHEAMPVVMFAPAMIAPVMPAVMHAIVRGDDEAGGLRRGDVDGDRTETMRSADSRMVSTLDPPIYVHEKAAERYGAAFDQFDAPRSAC